MSKSTDALNTFIGNWTQLKAQRPSESDFTVHGYPLSFSKMDLIFEKWKKSLAILDKNRYWDSTPEYGISDAPIASNINNLSSLVLSSLANGVGWLLGTNFIETVNLIQSQMASLARNQAGVSKEVAKIIADRGLMHIEDVINASRAARYVLDKSKDYDLAAQRIIDASEAVVGAEKSSDLVVERLEESRKIAEKSRAEVEVIKQDIEKKLASSTELADKLLAREKELENRSASVEARIKEMEELAKNAIGSVNEALRKARDQGLAKSFQDRSSSLQFERKLWTYGFAGSAVVLLVVAIVFTVELPSMTVESLAVHLLRKVGVAAPLIWIGWYSARQVGRVARVQEDYEYKAASALAFQSYKDEVKLGGDPELEAKLLDHAIKTFGDNPVRLYENHDSDSVSPLQDAIKQLPPEKIASILSAVSGGGRQRFWPFWR